MRETAVTRDPGVEAAGEPSRRFGRFFLPGPTEVSPEVLEAQAAPMIGHRGRTIEALMSECQAGLRILFRTERPVLVSTSSATGMMEAGVRNAVRRRVLALVNGAFSERFADIAEACGFEVERMDAGWGGAHDPGAVAERLRASDADAVTVVHSETSTGVLNPIQEIQAAVREASGGAGEVVLLVDSVSGLGGAPVETDAWGLDYVLTGSQKALALPPGLAFAAASEGVLERARTAPRKGVYFDLVEFVSRLESSQTPNTPAVSLLYALRAQLARIRAEGMDVRWARHRAMAERCWRWAEETADRGIAVSVLAPEGRRSPTVTCFRLPEGLAGPALVSGLKERGWVVGAGYGELKPTTFRIGHMGEHTPESLEALLSDATGVLESLASPASAGGAGA